MKNKGEGNSYGWVVLPFTVIIIVGAILWVSGYFRSENLGEEMGAEIQLMLETKAIEVLVREYSFLGDKGEISILCDDGINYYNWKIPFKVEMCEDENEDDIMRYLWGEIIVHRYTKYPRWCRFYPNYDLLRNISKNISKTFGETTLQCSIIVKKFPKLEIVEHLGLIYENETITIYSKDGEKYPLKEWVLLRNETVSRKPYVHREIEERRFDFRYPNQFLEVEEFIYRFFIEMEFSYYSVFEEEDR